MSTNNKKKTSSSKGVTRIDKNFKFDEYEHGDIVPPSVYLYVQYALGFIRSLEKDPNDSFAGLQLKQIKKAIHYADVAFYPRYLPSDWKFDRANADKYKPVPYCYGML